MKKWIAKERSLDPEKRRSYDIVGLEVTEIIIWLVVWNIFYFPI